MSETKKADISAQQMEADGWVKTGDPVNIRLVAISANVGGIYVSGQVAAQRPRRLSAHCINTFVLCCFSCAAEHLKHFNNELS